MQRKPGTARGSPRRSRTAKALRISRYAVKSRCACERGGWGRISDDGSGQYNPNRSEGPWGKATLLLAWRCSTEQVTPAQYGGSMLPRSARRMEANLIPRRACWEQA